MAKSREKFVELAEKRVNKALKDLRLIGNLSNKSNYIYTDKDTQAIYKALKTGLDEMKARFDQGGEESKESFRL